MFVAAETAEEVAKARDVLRSSGAESLDAAREAGAAYPADTARYEPVGKE